MEYLFRPSLSSGGTSLFLTSLEEVLTQGDRINGSIKRPGIGGVLFAEQFLQHLVAEPEGVVKLHLGRLRTQMRLVHAVRSGKRNDMQGPPKLGGIFIL